MMRPPFLSFQKAALSETPFFAQTRLLIVAGKGGVGKTTVAAVTANTAAQAGLRTLLVAVDTPSAGASLFGAPALTEKPMALREGLDGRFVTPDKALLDWLRAKRVGKLADRLVKSGALDMIATAVPGIRDILILGLIKALVNANEYDLIVLDAPASGHAVSMLQSAFALRNSVTVGAIRQQADDVHNLLVDQSLTQVVLVTVPEMTPVTETIETAFALEDRVGVRLGPVIVNQLLAMRAGFVGQGELPVHVRALVEYREARELAQHKVLQRLHQELPLPLIGLPFVQPSQSLLDQLTGAVSDEL